MRYVDFCPNYTIVDIAESAISSLRQRLDLINKVQSHPKYNAIMNQIKEDCPFPDIPDNHIQQLRNTWIREVEDIVILRLAQSMNLLPRRTALKFLGTAAALGGLGYLGSNMQPQTKPAQTKPEPQTKPAQTKPEPQIKPAQTKPEPQIKPAQTKPEPQTKPAPQPQTKPEPQPQTKPAPSDAKTQQNPEYNQKFNREYNEKFNREQEEKYPLVRTTPVILDSKYYRPGQRYKVDFSESNFWIGEVTRSGGYGRIGIAYYDNYQIISGEWLHTSLLEEPRLPDGAIVDIRGTLPSNYNFFGAITPAENTQYRYVGPWNFGYGWISYSYAPNEINLIGRDKKNWVLVPGKRLLDIDFFRRTFKETPTPGLSKMEL